MDKNILLSESKCSKIFSKYNLNYKDIFENKQKLFERLYEIPNINYKIIKNCIDNNPDIDFINYFFKGLNNDIYKSIRLLKYYIDINNIDKNIILLNEINKKLELYDDNKNIYSLLKSLLIRINKKISIERILNNIQHTLNIKRIIFYANKISNYIDKNEKMDYLNILHIIDNIINNKDIKKKCNIEPLFNLINKCKNNGKIVKNDLEMVLMNCDKDIYSYVYFLNNSDNLVIDKNNALKFIYNFGYSKKSFKQIDGLNLKRGFIQGLVKNNKNYLLKYQPNKSFMELVLNSYIRVLDCKNFLIPHLFFINNDNSYFYVIEKYDIDLYKYFNLLEFKKKILTFNEIIDISKFILNSIKILHKNNIIHSDLKLENIVLNINKDNYKIDELKIIDFDVGLFNIIPESLKPIPEKYEKIFNNKKPRGTRIYMIKDKLMSFENDIFGFGVILLILLYKNTKILLTIKKSENSKNTIKYHNLKKKMGLMRESIEKRETKIKLLNLIEKILMKEDSIDFFDNNKDKFCYLKELIIDSISGKGLDYILGSVLLE